MRRLYDDLTAAGFDVWFDRESMPSRALTFLQGIRDAIAGRNRLLLVVGPGALASEYVTAEWRRALDFGIPINPVLRLVGYDALPDELKLLDAPDFRDDTHYPERFAALVRQLREPVPPMGKLVGVPSLPQHLLKRADRLRALTGALPAEVHPQVRTVAWPLRDRFGLSTVRAVVSPAEAKGHAKAQLPSGAQARAGGRASQGWQVGRRHPPGVPDEPHMQAADCVRPSHADARENDHQWTC